MSAHRMSAPGLTPQRPPSQQEPTRLLQAAAARLRQAPAARALLRRRLTIRLTKWLLPAAALALLTAIALWPEFDRATERARITFRRIAAEIEGATMVEPRYRGVDERNRPYTVTAERARQTSQDRIDMVAPKADITMEDGRWLMLQSRKGVYIQSLNQVDLSDDVILYRDDGTTITTATASVDLKAGAAASADPVHVEGPFGTIDAQGFTVTDKGAALHFTGPAQAVLNGASR
jgi:lipopolysaccharide export system protein LptC